MGRKIKKSIFISSTIYDLRKERSFIRNIINIFKSKYVILDSVMSEFPDFPVTLNQIRLHSLDICLKNVAKADYFILIIKRRYGYPILKKDRDYISITHMEYLKAYSMLKPIFVFVDQRTWDALNRFNKNYIQKWVSKKQIMVFDFINMISKRRRNWITIYKSLADIRIRLETSIFCFDHSVFIGDITIPDGEIIKCGQEFTKIWEIKNAGFVPWIDRKLIEVNSGASGLCPTRSEVHIPNTNPGEHVRISIRFKAPYDEATCISKWKMVDKFGEYSFPYLGGIWCKVKVVYDVEI